MMPARTASCTLVIGGMSCTACSSCVEGRLQGVQGVQSASVALLSNTAEVRANLRVVAELLWAALGGFYSRQMAKGGGHGRSVQRCAAPKGLPLPPIPATLCTSPRNKQVVFDARLATPAALVAAVEDCGFTARAARVENAPGSLQVAKLAVGGLSCSACSAAVESALAVVPGVASAVVSVALQEAKVGRRK